MILALAVILIGAGLVLLVINGGKLASDWPRLKPVHNVDATWIQIYAGLLMLGTAWFLLANPAHKLTEPEPQLIAPEAAAEKQAPR